MRPVTSNLVELILNRTWRPALAVTGASGLPELGSAGNVLRPQTTLKLSLRLPPTLDAEAAAAALKAVLERDPPYGARVTFTAEKSAGGWHAPPLAPWLRSAVERASKALFGREAAMIGEGGSIPFMGMLGASFPEAQFVITGVLGPASNAHGPNEFLHIPTAKRIAGAVAMILSDHAHRSAFREAA
jgi:acetylornithine deacetylase/succinyl-diaminopimelate desuccinylase-like protein